MTMADEKDTAGATGGTGSNPGKAPVPQIKTLAESLADFARPSASKPVAPPGLPEPVILEEHVVEKAPAPIPAAPAPVAAPAAPTPQAVVAPAPLSSLAEDVGLNF